MIIRSWSGRTLGAKADEYQRFLERVAIPDYQSVPGLLNFYFTRVEEGEATRFTLFTVWESLDAIRAFAGADVTRAKYYPEDKSFLLEFPERVTHYEVFAAAEDS